eukprot:15142018-Alexandrium_andersonii.AAC.1
MRVLADAVFTHVDSTVMQLCFTLAAWDSGSPSTSAPKLASEAVPQQRGQLELLAMLDSVASIRERLSRVLADTPFRALVGASCLRSWYMIALMPDIYGTIEARAACLGDAEKAALLAALRSAADLASLFAKDLAHSDCVEVLDDKNAFASSWSKLFESSVGLRSRSRTIEFQPKPDAHWHMMAGSLHRKLISSKATEVRAQLIALSEEGGVALPADYNVSSATKDSMAKLI